MDDDRICMEKIARGGKDAEKAISVLYERYAPQFLRILRTGGFSPEESEDVLQDTFVQLVKHRGAGFTAPDQPESWLKRILSNCAVDHWRRRKNEVTATTLAGSTGDDDLPDVIDAHPGHLATEAFWDCAEQAFAAFRREFPEAGEALQHSILEGWDNKKLATFLKKKDGAVREFLSQWRRRLREFLEQFCQEYLELPGN